MKRSRVTDKELTVQQELFCQEYLKDLHAANAFRRAGFTAKNDAVANANACRLMSDPRIQSRVAALAKERAERVQVDADRILSELVKLAFVDISKIFDERNAVLPTEKWPEEARKSLASIEVDEIFDYEGNQRVHIGYTKKVKFWPKTQALDMLGRHLKMFTTKHEVELGKQTLEQLVAASRQALENNGGKQ